jgi:hypothetical protein
VWIPLLGTQHHVGLMGLQECPNTWADDRPFFDGNPLMESLSQISSVVPSITVSLTKLASRKSSMDSFASLDEAPLLITSVPHPCMLLLSLLCVGEKPRSSIRETLVPTPPIQSIIGRFPELSFL